MNGGGDSVCIMIGASNHSLKVRERNDYYATPPVAVERLLELEEFHGRRILEPCCGEGHISKVLERRYEVVSNDLIDRGFGNPGIDFLGDEITEWDGDIVMNPPYGLSMEFVVKALDILSPGRKLAAFLKLTFAEGKARRKAIFDENPPARIWVSSSRLECGKNGVFGNGSAVCYAWWIWEKGLKDAVTEMRWFN